VHSGETPPSSWLRQNEVVKRFGKVHLRTTAKHVTALVNHELPHSPGYGHSVHSDPDQQTQR